VRDTLLDVERVFYLLDNREMPEYGGIVGVIERSRRDQNPGRMAGFQSECESEYFRAYAYINGNLHLWFKRDDLVTEVNKLLAEYYGEVLAHDNPDTDEGDLFSNRKTTPARRYGLFPTPDDAAEQLIQAAKLYRREEDPRLHVLEPSAGTGNLARRCAEKGAAVDCVEIQPHLAGQLQAEGKYRKVLSVDFLMLTPEPAYDKVVMNPPFDMERDIDHVMHAWGFLKDDGHLVAIMSAGTEFRETKKAGAFRKFVEKNGGRFRDLPPGSFRESGTNVNTVIVSIAKGRTPRWWHF
jgi:predicted RNA methylase